MVVENRGWIGVDLDGTCFTYHEWVGWNVFGEPIAPMIERIRGWLAEGRDVRVVTARVGLPFHYHPNETFYGVSKRHKCRVTGVLFSDADMIDAIQDLFQRHVGRRLPVQCYKDADMTQLWDDRAVQIVPNTGATLAEEHAAEMTALRGKVFQDQSDADEAAIANRST